MQYKKNKKDKKPFHDCKMERKTLGSLWKTTQNFVNFTRFPENQLLELQSIQLAIKKLN